MAYTTLNIMVCGFINIYLFKASSNDVANSDYSVAFSHISRFLSVLACYYGPQSINGHHNSGHWSVSKVMCL